MVSGWEWLPSSGACPICLAIAARARFVKLGQPFAVIGDNPVYSTIKFPPAHPNCTCTYLQILIDEHPPNWSSTLQQPQEEPTDAELALVPIPLAVQPKPKPATSKPKPVAPRKPRTPKPSGSPVSDGLQVQIKIPALQSQAEQILGIVDRVHGDGKLPRINLESMTDPGYEGWIHVDPKGNPLLMALHENALHPASTLAHEIGHFLDYGGIPVKKRIGNMRDFAADPLFAGFLKACNVSDALTGMRALGPAYKTPSGREYPTDTKYVNYLLSPNEVWARAYAQWLALRSQNSDLLKGIADARRLGAADPYAGRQWEDADFEPIAKEIDAIFKKLGWRK